MPNISRRILFIKLAVVAAAFTFAMFGFQKLPVKTGRVSASAQGPTSSHTNAPNEDNCTACHSDFAVNSGTGSVTITGLPAGYSPNQQIAVTVTTSQSDGVIYGFQLTAIDSTGKKVGTFILPSQSPAQTQIISGIVGGNQRSYVEHTVDGIAPTMFGSKSWTFTWKAPAQGAGTVRFYAAGNASNSDGGTSGDYIYTTSKIIADSSVVPRKAISDFDGDGKSDTAVFRPSTGTWYSLNSSNGNLQSLIFGANGDKVVAGDYDGDGKTDFAVWRPSNGTWYVQRSTAGFTSIPFGISGDAPAVGDYDGDGKSDYAVFRPSNGTWYILRSSDGALVVFQFGISTDKIAQGDFDGDGKTDIAVFRPSNGNWYIQRSQLGFTNAVFGISGDKPTPADFDGDGKTDLAIFRPSNGTWYLQRSTAGFTAIQFGVNGDKPAPADFDGDGKADIAILRDGVWYISQSASGFKSVYFGTTGDIAVPSGNIAEVNEPIQSKSCELRKLIFSL